MKHLFILFASLLSAQLHSADDPGPAQRWHVDVPWGTEIWRPTQLLALHQLMDRPGENDVYFAPEGYDMLAKAIATSIEGTLSAQK